MKSRSDAVPARPGRRTEAIAGVVALVAAVAILWGCPQFYAPPEIDGRWTGTLRRGTGSGSVVAVMASRSGNHIEALLHGDDEFSRAILRSSDQVLWTCSWTGRYRMQCQQEAGIGSVLELISTDRGLVLRGLIDDAAAPGSVQVEFTHRGR